MQRLRLRLAGDGAYDGVAHDVAVTVYHIGGGIGKDVRGKSSRLAAGGKIHVPIGRALLGQHILRLGNCRFVAVQREGVDADDLAALLRKLLVQRVQFGKLTHAGIAGGEPEIHYGDGVAGEQLVAFHRVSVQILALKGRELLHAAIVRRRGHIVARRHAHVAVQGLLCRCGILFLNHGQLIFDVANLLRLSLNQFQLIRRKLILGGFNCTEQEITVVFAVLLHGHALVGRHENLFPKRCVLRENGIFLRHQLLVHGSRFLSILRFAAHSVHFVSALCAAVRQREHHQCNKQQCQ